MAEAGETIQTPKSLSLLTRYSLPLVVSLGLALSLVAEYGGIVGQYQRLVLMYVGINIILTLSLNLVNGYMGEFSVGHAGFMAIGAYAASFVSVRVFPADHAALYFPFAIIIGGIVGAVSALVVAIPSFKTRGDYLAIVTLAFLMIVKSAFENIRALGGGSGFLGIAPLSNLPSVYIWVILCFWVVRNYIYSTYGRGVLAIREDELAAEALGVKTARVKLVTFLISAFFAAVAGGLFAHVLQFIYPRSFDIYKSTEILVMVYLGGVSSLSGSVVGATLFTVLLELLRSLKAWRMVLLPLMLVILMIFRPKGIMGEKELTFFLPLAERLRLKRSGH